MSRSCWCAQAGHQMSLCVEHMASVRRDEVEDSNAEEIRVLIIK